MKWNIPGLPEICALILAILVILVFGVFIVLPTIRNFLSITPQKEGYMVKNPINRYKISSSSDLDYNEDGSLDIYLQHSKPEQGTANWMPVPEGGFQVTLRLYQPEERFLNGTWKVPPIKMTE
ncbi:MAG: DUF1214 domain-containing protein [Desulfobacterales bacterium]|nr:DUF1214 domain-containing protein [Desulfobacterales bacterium]